MNFKFVKSIFGERDFEIRLIEEGVAGKKNPISILRHGDYIYSGRDKRKLARYCEQNLVNVICLYSHNQYFDFENYAVFFVPNSPNFEEMASCTIKDKDVVYLNCQSVDIDCKDEDIRSDEKKLQQWKKEQYDKIMRHKVKPSIIVVTKNGLHCYWLLSNGTKELYRYVQLQLIKDFGGDTACVNESHCLRMAGFYHKKDRNNPFPVYVAHHSELRYSQEELKNLLPELEEKEIKNSIKTQRESKPIDIEEGTKSKLISILLEKLNYTNNNSKKIICHCPMPNHKDNNPSAWFDKDYLWFHCSGCGTHLPLEELALELEWDDVLEELTKPKYQLEIESLYGQIRKNMVKVQDIEELKLSPEEEAINIEITKKVFEEFELRNQVLNEIHKQYINEIIQILLKGKSSITPDLIPLDIGGGKSTIIEIFISEMLQIDPNFGCIVVKERKEDVKKLAKSLDKRVGRKVAYALYGFEKEDCLASRDKCNFIPKETLDENLITYLDCKYHAKCRYACRNIEQAKYPIVITTHENLFRTNEAGKLSNLAYFGEHLQPRQKLLIDEKPKQVYFNQYESMLLNYCEKNIIKDLPFINIAFITEFEEALEVVKPYFQNTESFNGRQSIKPINVNFKFSEGFLSHFDYHFSDKGKSVAKLPEFLGNLIRNGGHRDAKGNKVFVSTSRYNKNTYEDLFHTMIFDGTADIDLTYRHEDYRVFDFKPIRTYENFTMYQCNYLKSSKKQMKKGDMVTAFCEQVKEIAKSNPKSKIYVPVFSEHEKSIKWQLEELIEKDIVRVDHYGGTKGKNDYLDCDIIVIEGLLHKTEDYYISLHRALTGEFLDDLGCSYFNKFRRFNNPDIETIKVADMLSDYAQEIKRSNQRDNTTNVSGQLYIFTQDVELLKLLPHKFPACKVEEWNPISLIENKVFKNEHKQAKNDEIICNFFRENSNSTTIKQEEIIEKTGLDKTTVSRVLSKKHIKAYITELGFKKTKEGKNIVFVRNVR